MAKRSAPVAPPKPEQSPLEKAEIKVRLAEYFVKRQKQALVDQMVGIVGHLRSYADDVELDTNRLFEESYDSSYGYADRVESVTNSAMWLLPNLGVHKLARRVRDVKSAETYLKEAQAELAALQPAPTEMGS